MTTPPLPTTEPEVQRRTGMVGVGGAELLALIDVSDARGRLVAGEVPKGLPFTPRRFFLVSGAADERVRGERAHRSCHELFISVVGQAVVALRDGRERAEVVLDTPALALHVPPGVWSAQRLRPSSVLLVLASHPYDPDDYLPDLAKRTATQSHTVTILP